MVKRTETVSNDRRGQDALTSEVMTAIPVDRIMAR
ncbi:hypothetical protein GETHLI_28330 [Geothrix limicola]|uniref:Uncharacterized protein n=1 Tax=Geothrix limicola TaxID=2927978 RepID=A0ABQ5QIW6_9BACT|nr:hypothetical protein GETHLI_28330 [Geothrix limicola]